MAQSELLTCWKSMKLVTKRKGAQQPCFVQTVEKNNNRCLRKTAHIADEVITLKNTVQQRGYIA